MDFLKLPSNTYNHYIVKMNVVLSNFKEKYSHLCDYVFVFSVCKEEDSLFGEVKIELVPERDIPVFDPVVRKASIYELSENDFIDHKAYSLDGHINIIKSESDFDTKYIAVLKNQPNAQPPKNKYVWLLSHNRGKIGKLEHEPFYYFSPWFQLTVCDLKAKQRLRGYEYSINNINKLKGEINNIGDVVALLEQEKAVEARNPSGECLRSLLQKSDT